MLNRYLVPRIVHSRFYQIIAYASRHVTALYIIQWTLICWGMGVVGYATLNSWQTLIMMPVMLMLTLIAHNGLILPAGQKVQGILHRASVGATGTAS